MSLLYIGNSGRDNSLPCLINDSFHYISPTDGEEIPEPPKPKSPAPPLPKDFNNEKLVDKWKEDYKKWSDENSHLPGLQTSEQIIERFKAQVEARKKQQQNPNTRITVIEQKLDKLMNHLGVK